jgi:hypothetical protein
MCTPMSCAGSAPASAAVPKADALASTAADKSSAVVPKADALASTVADKSSAASDEKA